MADYTTILALFIIFDQRVCSTTPQSSLRKELRTVTEVLAFDEHVAVLDLVVVGTLRTPARYAENILGVANAVSFATSLPRMGGFRFHTQRARASGRGQAFGK